MIKSKLGKDLYPMVNVAILGFGVVGSGAAEVLTDNRRVIEKNLGETVTVKRILDLRDFPDSPFAPEPRSAIISTPFL